MNVFRLLLLTPLTCGCHHQLHCDSVRNEGRGRDISQAGDVWSVGSFDVQLGAILLLHEPDIKQKEDVVFYNVSGSAVDQDIVAAGSHAYREHAQNHGISRASITLQRGDFYVFKAVS